AVSARGGTVAGRLKLVETRGVSAYASSNVTMRAASLPAMAVKSWGAHPAIHASPEDTELSCMLWLSVGVNQMKLVPALSCAMTVFEWPEIRFAHRAELPVIVVYDRHGK